MEYDFGRFLNESEDYCNSKSEFIKKIDNELNSISAENNGLNFIDRQLYLKRLSGAKFIAERGAIREQDDYNSQLLNLLDKFR